MEYGHWPFILVEVLLVFGSVVAFGWWQLRDLDRERRKTLEQRTQARPDAPAQEQDVNSNETHKP